MPGLLTRVRRRPTPARRPTPTAIVSMLVVVVTTAIVTVGRPPQADAALANGTYDPTPRVYGGITVIGDSVLQGSVAIRPTLGHQLGLQGWGPIRARAGVGYSTGYFAANTEAKATYWIDLWRSSGWDPEHVLVNLGANDSGRCDRDLQCARNAIMHLVDRIGPGHRIWWPQITRHPIYQHQADTWNLALTQIAAERDDFFTWDWPTTMAQLALPSWDNTHLDTAGYQLRSELLAYELTADLARGTRVGGDAPLPTPVGVESEIVPLDPVRVIDTRVDDPGRVAADSEIEIDVSAHVPAGSTAVAAYVSATLTDGPGYLTAYECSTDRPEASAANHLTGETRGAVTVVPISPDGTFCLYTLAEADLLVDLQAAFVPVGTVIERAPDAEPDAPDPRQPLRFDPLPQPVRLVDTRVTGRSNPLVIDAPDGAAAVAVSLTAVLGELPGYLTAYPCDDEPPLVATVNHDRYELISGTAFVPVGPDGTICVYSLNPVDVTVDLTGVFADDGALVFQPATPTRMIDTRDGTGGWSPTHGQFQQIDARVAPPGARAVTGTLTIVGPMRAGYLTGWGCGPQPETANVTSLARRVLANSLTTGIDDEGRLCVFARTNTASLFDTTGWWRPPS